MSNSIIMSKASEIEKAIVSIRRRGQKLDIDIQSCALSCLHHIEAHKDITLLCKLYDAMPKSSRRNALIEWAVAFGRVIWVKKGEELEGKGGKKIKADETGFYFDRSKDCKVDLKKADTAENKWWLFAPEKPYRPWSEQAMAIKLYKEARTRLEKNDKRDTVSENGVAAIQQLCEALGVDTSKL